MDVDDFLDAAELPDVTVSIDEALAHATRRGRERRHRRVTALGVGAVLVAVAAVAATLTLADRDEPTRVAAEPEAEPAVPTIPEPGDPAVWNTDPGAPPDPAASTFTALVSRLGCNSGVTGTVLRPGVVAGETEIVVTFTVEADPDGGYCPGNDMVAYDVALGEPLGDRVLVDGSCLPGAPAASTSFCSAGGGVRWRPGSPAPARAAPHECEAPEDSATDVAHEPDWRPYADYLPWTDGDGCLVRIDVVAERPGPQHCGWERAQVLIVGQPLGARYTTAADTTEYVRDPLGVFEQPALSAAFDANASLPADAVDSGFRRGDVSLWHIPDDPAAVWLVSLRGVERWPSGEPPLCL